MTETETEKAIRDFCGHHADWWPSTTQVQEMLALAQPEQEPMHPELRKMWEDYFDKCFRRKPLSDEEIYSLADSLEIWNEDDEEWILDPNTFARAIEAAHGIKEST